MHWLASGTIKTVYSWTKKQRQETSENKRETPLWENGLIVHSILISLDFNRMYKRVAKRMVLYCLTTFTSQVWSVRPKCVRFKKVYRISIGTAKSIESYIKYKVNVGFSIVIVYNLSVKPCITHYRMIYKIKKFKHMFTLV